MSETVDGEGLSVCAGVEFRPTGSEGLWRLRSGRMRLGATDAAGRSLALGIALPGDLLGAEVLTASTADASVRALTASRVDRVPFRSAFDQVALLSQALIQSRRQQRDLSSLRTGSVSDRIGALLCLLHEDAVGPLATPQATVIRLPALRDMAELIGTAPETVSRAIGQLRRQTTVLGNLASGAVPQRWSRHDPFAVAGPPVAAIRLDPEPVEAHMGY